MRFLIIICGFLFCIFSFNINLFGQSGNNWLKSFGGLEHDHGVTVATDQWGNIIIGATYTGLIEFGDTILNTTGPYLNTDILLAKFNRKGKLIWVKTAGGTYNERIWDMVLDEQGNIYLTGTFAKSAYFDNLKITSNGEIDIFWAKYNANGTAQMVKSGGGTFTDFSNAIDLDQNNNILISGKIAHSAIFDTIQIKSVKGYDIFVIKYNPKGQILFAKTFGGPNPEEVMDLVIDSNNDIYITGNAGHLAEFDGILIKTGLNQFGHHTKTAFLAKLDSSGKIKWVKTFPDKNGTLFSSHGLGLAVDDNNNIYCSGWLYDTILIDSFIIESKTIKSIEDAFLFKANSSGNAIWAKGYYSLDTSYTKIQSLFINEDELIVGGDFQGKMSANNKTYDATYTPPSLWDSLNKPDMFCFLYDLDGNIKKSLIIGDRDLEGLGDLVSTNSNNLFVIGSYFDSLIFENDTIISYGWGDIFLLKYEDFTTNVFTEIKNQRNILVYPNPTSNSLIFDFSSFDTNLNDVKVNIYTMNGRSIISKAYKMDGHKILINLSKVSPGYYLYELNFSEDIPNASGIFIKLNP